MDENLFTKGQRNKFLFLSLAVFIIQALIQFVFAFKLENCQTIMATVPAVIGLSLTLVIATLHFKYDYEPSLPYGIFLSVLNVILVGISVRLQGGLWSYLCFAIYVTLTYFIQLWTFEEHPSKDFHVGVAIGSFFFYLLIGILFFLFEYIMASICVILLVISFITRKTPVEIIIIIFIK